MSLFDGIKNIFTGGGALGSLARTVAIGYVLNRVTANANKSTNNNFTQPNNTIKLQVPPASNQKIPVLYGSSYFGGIISEAVMSNNNQRMTYVVTLAEKTGNLLSSGSSTVYTFGEIYWDDQRVYFKADGITIDYTIDRQGSRDESLRDLVKIYCYAGSSSSSNQKFPTGYSGTQVNAYSVVPNWNSAFAMNNLIFAVVEVNYSAERNVKGIANQLIFQVNSTMNKPGDVIYDYLTNNIYGANIALSEIDTTSLGNLNTYATSSVSYTDDSGPQTLTNRYQINGLIDTDEAVLKNVEQITNSSGSWLSYSILTGKWGVIINKSGTSVASFDDSNILSGISVQGTGLTDLYNSVKVEYPNRDIRDRTDYVQISIPAIDRNPNELDKILQISYPYINEPVQAQLLGFIELKQTRVDKVITFVTDYSYIGLNAGEIISVTNSKLGFSNKLFRIITVSEADDQSITCEITAIEYDSSVYDENLTRYSRVFSNGLTTLGNIGQPGLPTVTKYETAARPRIEVSSTAPTGTVEGMEFWLSNDTGLTENQRSYRLIATKVPTNGNANVRGTFTSGTAVTLDYDTLGASSLVVKTRAYNFETVGPFSEPSSTITFNPIQATDAILPTTQAYDSGGGLATALGIIQLIGFVDDLFGNNAAQAGGIFDKIFGIFKDETGYDILGETAGGNLAVSSQVEILDNGTSITNAVSSINFKGNTVSVALNNISDVEVTLSDPPTPPTLEVQDEGVSLSNAVTSINFVGATVTASGSSNVTVSIVDTNPYGNAITSSEASSRVSESIEKSLLSTDPTVNYAKAVFPCLFGVGAIQGQGATRCAVYTSSKLMFTSANTSFGDPLEIYSVNKLSPGNKKFAISVEGHALLGDIINRYRIGGGSSNGASDIITNTLNPNWQNLPATVFPGKISLYYCIGTFNTPINNYNSINWGNWNFITSNDGTDPNWQPGDITFSSGAFEGIRVQSPLACGSTAIMGTPPANSYPGAPTSNLTTPTNTRLCKINGTTFSIGLSENSVIAFGLSCFDIPNNTNFYNNTVLETFPYTPNGFTSAQYQMPGGVGSDIKRFAHVGGTFGSEGPGTLTNIGDSVPPNRTWPDNHSLVVSAVSPPLCNSAYTQQYGIAGCPKVKIWLI